MAEWISVKKRMPEKNGHYLCYRDGYAEGSIEVYRFAESLYDVDEQDFREYKRSGFYDYDHEWGYFEVGMITHWMPLPKKPKGEW